MRVRAEMNDLDGSNGFHHTSDIFQQKDLAVRLTSLFRSLDHGSVSLFHGRWGIGKTTFVRKWGTHLRNENVPAIYFDAFASDYIESPFQAVAGTFVKAAKEASRTNDPAYSRFLNQAAKVGRSIASTAAKIGVKAATLGVIGSAEIEQIEGVKDDIAESLSGYSEAAIKKLLEDHAEKEAEFESLRASLADLPRLLSPKSIDDQGAEDIQPLIVIIDELDRCRPDFALGVLETLKHFFRADRIHFVLVTNRDHLALSIAHRYGSGSSAEEYLEKFYDFVIYFDQRYGKHDIGGVSAFVALLAGRLLPQGTQEGRDISSYVSSAARAYRLSLRQIEAVFTNTALAFVAAGEREFRPPVLVTFLVLLKTLRPQLYVKAKAGTLTSSEFAQFLFAGEWQDFDINRVNNVFRYYLEKDVNPDDEQWKGYGRSLLEYDLDRKEVMPYLSNSVLDRFGRST